MNWDDVRLFLTIAEEGSFRQAALRLNLGHSTLSRRIESLEFDLGTRLFNRQSRGLTLTTAGDEMLKTAIPMHQEFDELQLRMFGQDTTPRGNIKLTVPALLLNHILLEALGEFCDSWPEISINVDNSLDFLNLNSHEADIAIRMTNNPGKQLIGRKIGDYHDAAYASKSYLEEYVSKNEKVHRWIYPSGEYLFEAKFFEPYTTCLPMEKRLSLPDPESQMICAERGLGFAMLPCIMADENPKLQRISNSVFRSAIWLLSHKDSRNNKRMKLFRDFLVGVFERKGSQLSGSAVS